MDKYLLQILLETKTIIIPGLGALTITNEETGEIMFMSYLKYDDGTLVKYISEKENISENDAQNLIAKYVTVIENKLTQGHEYEMFEFGKFFMKDGEIEFQNWRSSDVQNGSAASDKIEIEEAATPIEEVISVVEVVEISTPVEEEVVVHEEEKSLDQILSETKESEPEIKEEKKSKKEAKAAKAIKENTYTPPIKEAVVVAETQSTVDDVYVENTGETIIEGDTAEVKKVVVVKKKRKPIFWALIVLIVLLLAMATMTIFFYDQVKQYFPFMESQRTEVERNKANPEEFSEDLNESAEAYENDGNAENEQMDNAAVEESTEKVNNETAAPLKESAPVSNSMNDSGKNYYVIGGAFGEEGNANRFVEKLKAAGNQSVVVGQYDGLYLVAIDSYSSESEANQAISKFSEITSKAWVFHKR